MTDERAVSELLGHRYFQPHVTPIQLFNRATDPFLPRVKGHLFAVLGELDRRELTNHVLVITRQRFGPEDCARLDELKHLRVTVLFTYSGITDRRVEPFPSAVAVESLRSASAHRPRRWRTVLYWRPLVPGLNDTDEQLAAAVELSRAADATVFTGLFYRDEIAAYYRQHGLPEPYGETARRKIVPDDLERRVLAAFAAGGGGVLFRKTSCAVSYVHEVADYNGHYGIRELCDICPLAQVARCAGSHRPPSEQEILDAARGLPRGDRARVEEISERAVVVSGLDGEQPRYWLQHRFRLPDPRPGVPAPGWHAWSGRHRLVTSGDGGTMSTAAVWAGRSYAVVDVEGNGRRPASLVELAVVPIDAGVIGAPRTWLVRPPEPITGIAGRIHGIRNSDVAGAPVVAEVAREITAALEGRVLVAHNAHVDLDVLTRELPGWSPGAVIDTLRVSRAVLAGQMSSHKLGALAETFDLITGMPAGLRPHRADYDALVCARLLQHLTTVPGGEAAIVAAVGGQGGDDAVLF